MPVLEKINELRRVLHEQFGVNAIIEIRLHKHRNPHASREAVNHISFELANMLGSENINHYYCSQDEGFHWVTLHTRGGFKYTGFY